MANELELAETNARLERIRKNVADAKSGIVNFPSQLRQVATNYVAAFTEASDADSKDAVKASVTAQIDIAATAINGWDSATERAATKTALTTLLSKLND